MIKSDDLKAKIKENEKLIYSIEEELEKLKSEFASQTKGLKEKYNAEQKKKLDFKAKKPSALYTVGIVVAAVLTGLLEFNILPFGFVAEAIALVALVGVIIARAVVSKRCKKEYNDQIAIHEAEMEKYKREIDRIESANPRIAELDMKIYQLRKEKWEFEKELELVLRREALGQNVAVVYVTRDIRSWLVGYTRNAGLSEAHIIVDGMDKGVAQTPFSIIQLTPGFHSICIRFICGADFQDFGNIQFSLKDDISYITFTGIKEITTTNHGEDINGFLKASKISQSEFDSYVSRF
ncbi:MAG: hypothetical protein IKV16_06690 [Clostridia bacterium]|nr:hypothetical protein [Clostridia bacterium]